MNELQPLIDLLSAKHGWISAVPVWATFLMTASRVVLKPFNLKLQAAMTTALANAAQDPEDAAWWHDKVLTNGWYRLLAFGVDFATSVKLPTHSDFAKMTGAAPK